MVEPVRSQDRGFGSRFVQRLARGRPMGVGAYMFVAHRLTALAITIYLYVHLITLGSVLNGRESFDRTMALMNGTTIRLLELGLVALVLFHTLNGVRLSLLAFFPGISQRWLSYGVVTVSVVVVILSLPLFLR
jgi:succinate dehydrogenase / fumarate reductase cytochrome b subunit